MALKHSSKQKEESGLWPEEIEAIKNIKNGKTEMVTKTREEFLQDMERHLRERRKKELEAKRAKRLGKAA